MLLSISSSSQSPSSRSFADYRRATILLFAITVGLCGIAEFAARIGLARFSQIHRRLLQDRENADKVRPGGAGKPKTMLFVGNSSLLEGVDFQQLQSATSSHFRVTRFLIEQTSYYDWEFGVKGLLRHGVKPDYLVLCLSPGQLRSDTIRSDSAARFLFDLQDIWPVSRATHASLTTASNLYFSHFSTFYGTRSELRSVFIGKIGLERVQQFWHDITTVPLKQQKDMTPLYAARLKALSDLCRGQGVQFIFLVPPTAEPGDNEVISAGRDPRVPVLRPIPNYSLGPEYYRDGFHLNARGARIFTARIAEALAVVN